MTYGYYAYLKGSSSNVLKERGLCLQINDEEMRCEPKITSKNSKSKPSLFLKILY